MGMNSKRQKLRSGDFKKIGLQFTQFTPGLLVKEASKY